MISELEVYDIPFSDIEKRMVGWVDEALELRHGSAGDDEGTLQDILYVESPGELIHALLRVRQRSDRVDGLLSNITRARARVRRAQQAAEFEADRAYAEAAARRGATRVEYSSAKERHSEASLDAFEQKRIAAQAERAVSIATECYDVIRDVSFQLSAMRTELRAVLSALQFESTLER